MTDLPPYPRVDRNKQRPERLRAAAKKYRERAAELRRTLQGVEETFVAALDAADARKSIEQRLNDHADRSGTSDRRRAKLGGKR